MRIATSGMSAKRAAKKKTGRGESLTKTTTGDAPCNAPVADMTSGQVHAAGLQ
jgi:hypothetical protein